MSALPDEPQFSPAMFETGAGCSWGFQHSPILSMNDWFIAGPGPGVYREEWLRDLQAFRDTVRAGSGRVLIMNAATQDAWFHFAAPIANTLALNAGDSLYVVAKARAVEGGDVTLHLGFGGADSLDSAATMNLPGDGAWYDIDTTVTVPEGSREASPVVFLKQQDSLRVEISSVILGLDDVNRMKALGRALEELGVGHLCRGIYDRDDLAWAASAYSQYFVFMYDRSFYDPERDYLVEEFINDKRERFGALDSVILWPAYPRIGVDDRNQFDFFRDSPGGLEGVRDVCQRFQENGVRVLLPYLPWDQGTRRKEASDEEELAAIVKTVGADGVFLDTLTSAVLELRTAVDSAKEGVVLLPELCPPVEQLSLCNASWAQWPHDPTPPGMPLLKWIEPRHMQHYTCRWERSHQLEIETAFFNGTGMVFWENIFGTYNPCSDADATRWKRCSAILHAFTKEFQSQLWDPFYPSLDDDLYIHRWPGAPTTLFTLRNMDEPIQNGMLLRWQLPAHVRADDMQIMDVWQGRAVRWDMSEFGWVQVWGDVDTIGCIAVTFGDDVRVDDLMAAQEALETPDASVDAFVSAVPELRPITNTEPVTRDTTPEGMVPIPGGEVTMHIEHQRRECGCYPDPDLDDAARAEFIWGCPHDGMITHNFKVSVEPYSIDKAQVTNREYQQFLEATRYKPKYDHNFLKHWTDGVMPEAIADLPVVYVDLDDARAYADWAGKRLPTEPEWQRAAQGDDGRVWPWGNEFSADKCPPATAAPVAVRSLPESRSPYGCYLMAGNVWEWTESERDDGNTRFCIIRGGSYYKIEGSGWYTANGPQPLNTHTKFLLMWPGLDRCATIGFRCVRDAALP
jgi:gamma-glutamyl hercynylcysteine S-oxide synthase